MMNCTAVTALTGKQYSAKIGLSDKYLSDMRSKYGKLENWWKNEFGYDFSGLTESEARYLIKSGKDADALRNRIIEARDGSRQSVLQRTTSPGQTAQELKANLKSQLGKYRNTTILDTQAELPERLNDPDYTISGLYDPKTQQIYLVAENISVADSKNLLMHGVVHGVLYKLLLNSF